MTMAMSAPVIVPNRATPNRMSNQLMNQPAGEVMYDGSPWPRTVVRPQ